MYPYTDERRPRQGLCTSRAKKDFWIMILNHTGTFLVNLWWFIIGAFFIGYFSSLLIRQNILNQFQKMKIWNGGQLRKCFCIIDKVKRLSCATLRKFFLSGKISQIYHNSQWIGIYDYYYLYIFMYIYILLLLLYWKLSLCCFLMETSPEIGPSRCARNTL